MLLAAVSDALARDNRPRAMIVVMDNADDAQYMYSDLHTLTDPVWYFPSSRRRRQAAEDEAMAIQRTEVLTALAAAACANPIVVTYPEALEEPVPDKGRLQQHTLTVSVGQTCPLSVLCEQMSAWGFRRVDFVYEPGQYAVRGGIVDVYGYAHDNPYRLDYFGDEVESIREFDIESQLSQDKVEAIDIVASASLDAAEGTLADYTDSATLWVSNDWSLVAYKLPAIREVVEEGVATLEIGTKSTFPTCDTLQFDTLPQPAFNKNFDLLIQDLQARMTEGYRIYILADQAKQTDRLQAIFEDKDTAIRFLPTDHTLLGSEQSGFIADLGYDTYQRILNEAMLELKDEVGMDVAAAIGKTVGGNNGDNWCVDSQLESDLDLCFPESYIENISERITLYRELDSLSNEDSLLAYQKRLIDRFGVLPPAAEQLLNVVRLRWLCCSMGIEKVILKQGHLTLFFVRNNEAYWQSDIFGGVLQYVCSRPQRCRLQEERDKTGKPTRRRSVTIQQVTTITGALTLLRTIQTSSPAL